MSYCRWSSMNWRCDVYVYEDVGGGWTTHVARSRRRWPPIPDIAFDWLPTLGTWSQELRRITYPSRWHSIAAYLVFGFWSFWHNRVHMGSLAMIPLRPIGLPNDGETFNDATPALCANTLLLLRSRGYRVPRSAIQALLLEEESP